jgi:hypothetical protein
MFVLYNFSWKMFCFFDRVYYYFTKQELNVNFLFVLMENKCLINNNGSWKWPKIPLSEISKLISKTSSVIWTWNGQRPCAHVVLHDRIYVDFSDLLSYWAYIEVKIRHQTHTALQTVQKQLLNMCKFQDSPSGHKTCPANRPRRTLKSMTLKSRSNHNPGIMSCILITWW